MKTEKKTMVNYPILIIADLETRPQRRFQMATIIITDLRSGPEPNRGSKEIM